MASESCGEIVGCWSAAGLPAGRRYRSAGREESIQETTVWRKLPTIMVTAVIIATAVQSAATSTEVRRKEPVRLREASRPSTASILLSNCSAKRIVNSTNEGIASAAAMTAHSAAQ